VTGYHIKNLLKRKVKKLGKSSYRAFKNTEKKALVCCVLVFMNVLL